MDKLTDFLKQPIKTQMDFTSTVLAVVLVATVAFVWTRVLSHITET